MLKKYALGITIFYSIILAIVSFIHLSGLPEINYSNTDKIFHFIAYAVLSWLWFHALFFNLNCNFLHSLVLSAIVSILFGIIIEVLQGAITDTRVSDNNDILANSLGVCMTIIGLILFNRSDVKKY